ncbi:MAG: methylenetetrahydrofolate reductase [NAD(P)H] [Deltaproteobacteria bacterium]|nr:methylenetetrahydrofolate reductase [NAD(P)H] [Deltaproteobacteria bacterium]
MKIRDILEREKFSLSFEFFPPKRDGNLENLYTAIRELILQRPVFVSVTYGAGGGTREKTVEIASKVKNEFDQEVLAHLTCVQSSRDDIARVIEELSAHNIENILALRGDPPKDEEAFRRAPGGFGYASELVEFIHTRGDFSIGVAGYPEGHIEAPSLEVDLDNLKKKVDAGAHFIITQICFDNKHIYRFRDGAHARGIRVPIITGIFPIFNYRQIQRMAALCGAKIPPSLHDKLDKVSEKDEEVQKYGIEFAIRQSEDLLASDIAGLHFYSMNKSDHVLEILREIQLPREG